MRPIAWNARNEALLIALTQKVRFLSLEQIARTWWTSTEEGREAAKRHLSRLCHAGYLERRDVLVHPELALEKPVCHWRPGERVPDFGEAAYRCQKRWIEPPRMVSVWIATVEAGKQMGGFGGEIVRLDKATHDLHVATLYCRLVSDTPERAALWVPEELIEARRHERLPDAIFFHWGDTLSVMDFGGSCKASRVEKLHLFAERYRAEYELW